MRIALLLAGLSFAAAAPEPAKAQSKAHHANKNNSGSGGTGFARRAQELLGKEPVSKGEWGLLIADAQSGKILYEQNSEKYFVPASNMKLFTTALALERLGAQYRFRTTLESTGVITEGGQLTADLVLVGRGDPNLSNRKFPYELKEEFDGAPEKAMAELAEKLASKGVKEIAGDIVGDDSYFPRERYPSGWEVDDMVWEYGAAISAIVVDDNTVTLTLTPGENAGDLVTAAVVPATLDFTVQNEVTTSSAAIKSDLTLTREPGAQVVTVKGSMPAKSAPRKLVLAVEEPAAHAAALLKRALEERGIKVSGVARARHESISSPPNLALTPAAATGIAMDGDTVVPPARAPSPAILAEHLSIPLGEAVKLINKISQNLHTEMLLRTAARQGGVWNSPDELVKYPAAFYADAGIATGDILQKDGSGLSRHDLITPRAAVALLKYSQTRPWFTFYYDSLPVAGVDGTLEDRMKNTIAAGRVHAKTGSVEHVRTLSGFAETAHGRRLIFSFLSNNEAGKNHETADALTGLCVAMMEEFDAPAAKQVHEHKHAK